MYNQHTDGGVRLVVTVQKRFLIQRFTAYLQWNQLITKRTPSSMPSSMNMHSVAYWHECPVAGDGWVPDHRLSYGQHLVCHTHSGDSAGPSTGKTIRDDNEAWLDSCRVTRVLIRLQMTRYLVCVKHWDVCVVHRLLQPQLWIWACSSLHLQLRCRVDGHLPLTSDFLSPLLQLQLSRYILARHNCSSEFLL